MDRHPLYAAMEELNTPQKLIALVKATMNNTQCRETFSCLMTYIYIHIYVSYRTANLQTLHFIYLFNKYTY
jgi:hypothetical protein